MISLNMTRAEMIKWLGDAIRTETEKPFDKIDYDFVDECGQLLDKLMCDAPITDELTDEMAKLLPNTAEPVQRKAGHKRLWRISLLAAVVLCLSITVLAVPQLRTMLFGALQLDIGETVEDDGITYVNYGNIKQYEDITSLLATENLDILVFENPSEEIRITSIKHINDTSSTIVSFNDTSIGFKIIHDVNYVDDAIIANSNEYPLTNFTAYLLEKDSMGTIEYMAYIYYNNDTYLINCLSEKTLISVLNSLK